MNRRLNRLHLFGLALLAVAGCASPIVGAECAEPFTACDGRCVDLSSDPSHCGACGNGCPDGLCVDGTCPGTPMVDGGSADGSTDMGPADAGRDAMHPDFGPPPACACNLGESCCDGRCVNTDLVTESCGACGNVCAAGEVCSTGTCRTECGEGLTRCGDLCLDVSTDPNHCGACGDVCASGICLEGECSIGFPGHVVLIGHDYRRNRSGQNRVAGNAVFTSFASTPRVVAYRGAAHTTTVRGVDRAIDQVASERGGSWTVTLTEADAVPAALAAADVFLVYPQGDEATDEALETIGARWSVALDTFTRRGGVVVAFDGGGSHGGTWQLLASARVLDVDGRVDVTGAELELTDPSDTVAFGVPIRYVGEEHTVHFLSSGAAEPVISHDDGPVVLHRTILPR